MNAIPPALSLDEVHVWRGERHVLRGVSFDLNPGELLHVVGPNGAGKTTLLRVASGFIVPEEGVVRWQGKDVRRDRLEYQARLAFVGHESGLKADLTALENLEFAVGIRRHVTRSQLLACLERTGASACAGLAVRVLSAGQRRRVAMARVIASQATVWLLDEPFSNLDEDGMRVMTGLLEEHVRAGGAAVVAAHHGLDSGSIRELRLAA